MGTEGGVDQPYILYFSVWSYAENAALWNTVPLLMGLGDQEWRTEGKDIDTYYTCPSLKLTIQGPRCETVKLVLYLS